MRLFAVAASLAAALLMAPAHAADTPDKAAHQAAMQKLAFLVGEWEGNASIAMGPGPRQMVAQTERIQFKHDGTLLLIEGQGRSAQNGQIVHDALAVVSFDPATGQYKFRSFVAVGRFAETTATVSGYTMVWGLNFGQMKVRYTITVENGVWREIGERSGDEKTWTPFFEMTVKRK
jgi:hypothetical protein